MSVENIKPLLQESQFTKGLPSTVVEQLATIVELDTVCEGTTLFREGSQHSDFYLVEEGKIALEINVPGRGNITILTVGPGEFIGWSGLLSDGKMTSTAVALEDTKILRVPANVLNQLCDSDHEFCQHLLRGVAQALAQRLVATRLQMLDLFADEQPS